MARRPTHDPLFIWKEAWQHMDKHRVIFVFFIHGSHFIFLWAINIME